MARVELPVDKQTLSDAIARCEANGPLKNLSALHEAVAADYNSAKPPAFAEISFSVVGLRIKAWGLTVLSQPGKRGRQGPMTEEHKQKLHAARAKAGPKQNKSKGHPRREEYIAAALKVLDNNDAMQFAPLVYRIADGSSTAERKLGCLECVAYKPAEVRKCGSVCCSHFLKRPYQGNKPIPAAGEVDPEIESDEPEEAAA